MKNKLKIAVYDLEGYFIDSFEVDSLVELENILNINNGGISGCLSGKQLSSNGFQFKKVISNKIITKIGDVSNIHVGQSIKQVHKYYNDKYICTYNNINIASEKNKIEISSISKNCNNKQIKSGIYTFIFAN